MSFVDIEKNNVWSEQDIVTRTEAIIRGQFSVDAENILNRKVTGQVMGVYTLTADEQAELARYQTVCEQARQEGIAARADNELVKARLLAESQEQPPCE